jgi:hypothetical protein
MGHLFKERGDEKVSFVLFIKIFLSSFMSSDEDEKRRKRYLQKN